MSARGMRWLKSALLLIATVILVVAVIFEAGLAEKWIRDSLVSQIEQGTGGRVEIGGFHFHLWDLRAEIDNLTLHGLEAGKPAAAISCRSYRRSHSYPFVLRTANRAG